VYHKFHLYTGLPVNRLVVTHDNIKLSPFVTPESLKMFGNTNLKVYDVHAWEYVSSIRRQRAHVPSQNEQEHLREEMENLPIRSSQPLEEEVISESNTGAAAGGGERQEECGSPPAGLINLTVRTKDRQQVELSVKPTTTLRSIVKNSLIELGHPAHSSSNPPDPQKFKIHFDGEDLPFSSTVADHDLCDDDVLDLFFL